MGGQEQHRGAREAEILDVRESLQWLGDNSTPNLIDDPIHDVHTEVGLRQGSHTQHVVAHFFNGSSWFRTSTRSLSNVCIVPGP